MSDYLPDTHVFLWYATSARTMPTHFATGSCQNQDLLDFRISRIELAVARMATILKIL